jgi:hypothetical protein
LLVKPLTDIKEPIAQTLVNKPVFTVNAICQVNQYAFAVRDAGYRDTSLVIILFDLERRCKLTRAEKSTNNNHLLFHTRSWAMQEVEEGCGNENISDRAKDIHCHRERLSKIRFWGPMVFAISPLIFGDQSR